MVVASTGLRGVGILQVKLSTPAPVRLVTLKMLVVESIAHWVYQRVGISMVM